MIVFVHYMSKMLSNPALRQRRSVWVICNFLSEGFVCCEGARAPQVSPLTAGKHVNTIKSRWGVKSLTKTQRASMRRCTTCARLCRHNIFCRCSFSFSSKIHPHSLPPCFTWCDTCSHPASFTVTEKVLYTSFCPWLLHNQKRVASRFHFPNPNRAVPRSFAPTSGTDKVGTFTPAQPMAITAVPTCLLSEHRRDRQGQAEGSVLILLYPVLYGGPGGTGTVVSPAQQVLTVISSDMNVQNCQGASTQLLSGVVPANTPPSPWPHRHPVCLSVRLPVLLPLHTCAYIHMHAHHTPALIKVFPH